MFFMFLIFATITDIHSICIFCKHSICIFCKHSHSICIFCKHLHSICIFCKHLRSICIFCVPDFCHHYCSITDRESHPYIFIMMNLHPVNVAHCSARYYTVQISFSSLAKTMYSVFVPYTSICFCKTNSTVQNRRRKNVTSFK